MTIRINGDELPAQAIEYELGRLVRFYAEHMSEAEIRKQLDVLRERAKQQAIGAKLLLDEAGRLDIRVPIEDVEEKFSELVANCGGRAAFDKMMASRGTSELAVRAGISQGRRVDLLVERIAGGLSDPTEAAMRRHFESHLEEYARPPRVSAQHILIRFDAGNAQERATARAKLEKIRRDIEQGAEFADQAAMHSDCPSGKKSGGSLGWFSHGMLVPELDDAIFALPVGALSEILESPLGLHLVRKAGFEEGGPADYDDVREKVRDFLRHADRGAAIAAHVAELRAKAVIEEE